MMWLDLICDITGPSVSGSTSGIAEDVLSTAPTRIFGKLLYCCEKYCGRNEARTSAIVCEGMYEYGVRLPFSHRPEIHGSQGLLY
jgi:hypothetical protein